MRTKVLAAGLAAASALGLSLGLAERAAAADQCFYTQDWDGWKATPDSKVIYIRVHVNEIWRLELARACPELQAPFAELVSHVHGDPSICSPVDLDLRVREPSSPGVACIVSKMTRLSHEEASELPKDLRP